MLTHHRESLALAAVAVRRSGNERVRTMARRVAAQQLPEFTEINSWLAAWTPTAVATGTAAVTTDLWSQLKPLKSRDFDLRFLDLMIDAHQRAIGLSRREMMNGANPAVLTMAEAIIAAQGQQVADLQRMKATP
ncbi:uncharacterized protein (DUF305 family) [Nakamurella sp. UYEF19]